MAESAMVVEHRVSGDETGVPVREWRLEAVDVLTLLLTSALDTEDLVNRFFLDPIATGTSPVTKDLPMMIVDRFCENGGDPTTAVVPMEEVAEQFVIMLPGILRQEAAKPGSPLEGFAVISSLSQIKVQLDQITTHPYDTIVEATRLLSWEDPAMTQLGLTMLNDVMKRNQHYQQRILDILCTFLMGFQLPKGWGNAMPDDDRWIRGQMAIEELIRESIPLAGTRSVDEDSKLSLNLTGARMLSLNLVGRQVDRYGSCSSL